MRERGFRRNSTSTGTNRIHLEEVITQMGKMKKNTACGPDCLPIKVAKALGDGGAIWMTCVLNEAMRERIISHFGLSWLMSIGTLLKQI